MHLIDRVLEFARPKTSEKNAKAPNASPVSEVEKDRYEVPSGNAYTPDSVLGFIRLAESGDLRKLMAFYDEMRATDPHLDCELSKAEDYLTGARIDVMPYPPTVRGESNKGMAEAKVASEVAAYVESQVFAPHVRFDRAISSLADGLWKGVGGFSVIVRKERGPDGKEMLGEIVQIPSQRFRYLPKTTILGVQTGEDEKSLTPVKSLGAGVVVLVADAEVPSPAKRGILRRCAGPWLIRRYSPQWWARFVELFGSPLRVGKFNPGDEAMRTALVEALKKMGAAGWAALPDGSAIEFIEAGARSTGNPPHELLIDWAAREISKVILGATQTADVQRNTGSRASAQVHHDVTVARSAARATFIAAVIREQLIYPLVVRNFGQEIADLYTPEIKIRVETKPDVYNASQAFKMLMDAGMTTIPTAYVHDFLSIPTPDPEEPCLELPLLPGVVRPGDNPENSGGAAPSKKAPGEPGSGDPKPGEPASGDPPASDRAQNTPRNAQEGAQKGAKGAK